MKQPDTIPQKSSIMDSLDEAIRMTRIEGGQKVIAKQMDWDLLADHIEALQSLKRVVAAMTDREWEVQYHYATKIHK